MNNNFKKIFFSNLLVVLVIISNLVGIKYTSFNGLIISVNFAIFPFIYLCYLLIRNLSNRKEAFMTLLSSVFIQIFILLGYIFVTKLSSQTIIPDFASYINVVFKINEIYIIINLIALIISTIILEYIYNYFKGISSFLGLSLSLLIGISLYGLITIPIINYGFGLKIVLDIIKCHLIISCLMTFIITIMFYLLKEKECLDNDINNNVKIEKENDKKSSSSKSKSNKKPNNSQKSVKK